MVTCQGICSRISGKVALDQRRYSDGRKRCSYCAVYIVTDEIHCPCCHIKLRTAARSSRSKKARADIVPRVS
jgi:uncharacterized paraquat-inducible protein A